ncbi:MAG: glycosyltransferase family 1 protein [Thermodesulfobacteriota bacterium]
MRVGINALFLLPGKVGGTEIYTRNITRHLLEKDNSNEYVIFINRESAGVFEELASGPNVPPNLLKVVLCPVWAENRPLRILWEQFILPFQVKSHRIDVLLSGGMTAPFLCPAKSALVIYDLQHVNQPRNFSTFHLFFLRTIIYLSAKSSDAIITLAQKGKDDITKHYGVPPEKVSVVHTRVDEKSFFVRSEEEVTAVKRRYDLPDRFILYPAASLPHKNHRRLLQAFKLVRGEGREGDLKLLLVGSRDYGREELERNIRELALEEDVILLGWLPYEDIPPLYSAALALVFPSLHEGFGMPVVEAMACGTPVVCSGIEPMGEVAGDAALFVDPLSPEDIAAGILRVLEDEGLSEGLVKKGFERSRHFSWEVAASKTLSVLQSLAGPGGKEKKGR